MKSFHSPKKLELELLFITLVMVIGHALGSFLEWYQRYFFLDIITHFAGGIWIVFAGFSLVPFFHRFKDKKNFIVSLAIFALFAGALWELFEFSLDRYTSAVWGYKAHFQGSPLDTVSDLLIDTLGGAVGAFYLKKQD